MATEYPFHTALFFTLLVIVAIRMYFSGYADARSGEKQTTKGGRVHSGYFGSFLGCHCY